MSAGLAIAACDAKHTAHDAPTMGPPVHVLASNIDGAAGEIPADGFIQLAFDRYLLPETISRQSWAVLDANHQPLQTLGLKTIYDPVARTVTLTGPDGPGKPWLTETLTYHLILFVPPDDLNDQAGFRAIDRAPLDAPRDYTFRAGKATQVTQIEPVVDFCADVMPIFYGSCQGGVCHQTDSPATSLVLTTADGVQFTAVNRVAQGANTGGRAGAAEPPGRIFGLDMALIAPFDPGSSWLMYKVELPPPAPPQAPTDADSPHVNEAGALVQTFETACTQPAGTTTKILPSTAVFTPAVTYQAATSGERAILSNYVIGNVMPYPSYGEPLTFQERETIRSWIASGAVVKECRGCGTLTVTLDAGTPPKKTDAGTDSGTDAGDGGDAGK